MKEKIKNIFSIITIYVILILILIIAFLIAAILYLKDKICDIFRKEKKCKGFWFYMDFLDLEDSYDYYCEE